MSKITSLFSGSKDPPAQPPLEPLPTTDTAAVQEAERLKRESEVRRRRGSLATVLTSGMGVEGETPADRPALRPTLG